jgi:hypothetical protein
MVRVVAAAVLLLVGGVGLAQSDGAAASAAAQDQPTVATMMAEMLHRAGDGHSPTVDEVQAAEALPGVSSPEVAKQVEPLLAKGVTNPDAAVRKYALAMLVGMQSLPDVTPAGAAAGSASGAPAKGPATGVAAASGPAIYKGAVAKALAPAIPAIGAELTDEDQENRMLAVTDLGGFSPDPPAAVYGPLLAYLKRDDAVGAVGIAVVGDLLQIGPVNDETAAAIARYVRRDDQTADSKANLVEAIAGKPYQSQVVNKAVVGYLGSDDPSLQARTILSLPQMDLAPEVYADTKAKLADIVAGGQENLQVVNAAKAVSGCWVQVKMTAGCPVY